MIRLNIDITSNLITGYEIVDDESKIYNGDILFKEDEIDLTNIKKGIINKNLYYNNNKIQNKNNIDNYQQQLINFSSQISTLDEKINNETQSFIDAMLSGSSIEEAISEIKNNKIQYEQIKQEYENFKKQHEIEIQNCCKEKWKKEEQNLTYLYYISVCLLIRDENKYLQEWLEWHYNLGIDHCYIYDNGVKESVEDIIPKTMKEWITVIPFHDKYINLQSEAYNHFLQKYSKETYWVNFIDSDEFIRMTNEITLKDYLKQRELYTSISIPFIEYNANGQEKYEDKPVRERFTQPQNILAYRYHKDFVHPNRISKMDTHYPRFSANYNCTLNADKTDIVIDHYTTKSWEEWKEKMQRGSCDPNWLRGAKEFFTYNPDMEYLRSDMNYPSDQSYNV